LKTLLATAVGTALTASVSFAANGHMVDGGARGGSWMDGDWMGGYSGIAGHGGVWAPTLLVIVVVALVAWVLSQKRK
jgi:hypothetical protein